MGISQSSNRNVTKPVAIAQPTPNDYVITKKRANVILFMRYIGTGYHGLQYQNNNHTIDGVLFESLEKCGYTQNTGKNRGKYSWMDASRTDSGVHACAQLVAFIADNVEIE